MNEYYIIGENREITTISGALATCAVEVAGTIRAYWRNGYLDDDVLSAIWTASSSDDGKTWTAPTIAYDEVTRDIYPCGVVFNGTDYVMAVASKNVDSDMVVTQLVVSPDGLTFTATSTVPFTEYWSFPTDLALENGIYYLAASVRPTIDAPILATVKTSTDLSTWSALGYANQLNVDWNVWTRITVIDGTVHAVFREGGFTNKRPQDRILYAVHDPDTGWGLTSLVVAGTGNPDIAPLVDGFAIIYLDQTIQGGRGVWSWVHYDGETFKRRGAFAQGFQYGQGGSVITHGTAFASIYADAADESRDLGTLFFRAFVSTTDEATVRPFPGIVTRDTTIDELDNFSVEISYGQSWLNLTNGLRYYMAPDDFGDRAQVLRRITASSPFYEGTYLIHAVRENVTESLTVGVLGVSQNQVTENLLLLEEAISQQSFNVAVTIGDHREVWTCQQADYTIQRGHVMMHNVRAMMKISIPRLPDVTYEVT